VELPATGGVTGKGFQPGQSGNPGGRPKGIAAKAREVCGSDGEKLITFWFAVMNDASYEVKDRLAASRLLSERGFGKPPQFMPIEDADPLALADARADEIAVEFDTRLGDLERKRRERAASA
jgi:uncharacterized protein DUF5681